MYNKFMPNDVITLNALVYELNCVIKDGRIDKISQPEKDELLFSIRASGQNYLLAISVNPNNPKIHLTETKKDNPYTAFSFLMHLRKHIQGATIKNITLPKEDRIICFELSCKTEMKDSVNYGLYIELMGRYSNIVLVNDKGNITDALRHFPPTDRDRCILPNAKYEMPQNAKVSPFDYANIRNQLQSMSGVSLFEYASKTLGGMASSTLLEIIYRSNLSPELTTLFEEEIDAFVATVQRFIELPKNQGQYLPCLEKGTEEYRDYCICPYIHSGKSYQAFKSLNDAVDIFNLQKEKREKLARESKNINIPLNREIKRTNRIISNALIKIEDSRDADKYRIMGELLTCNLHKITKGQHTVTLNNFYDSKEIEIALDIQKTPVENAQSYYKKYHKLKRTFDIVTAQLEKSREELDYLLSVRQNLSMAEEVNDIEEIRQELEKYGIIKKNNTKKNTKPAITESLPANYEVDEFVILRGKNNLQNTKLTFKTAKDEDIWMHIQKGHGAHIIIKSKDTDVPENVLIKAAEIASYFSEFKNNSKAIVDYTLKKYVKRHPSNKSGMVIYTQYKSLVVKPNKNEDLLLN